MKNRGRLFFKELKWDSEELGVCGADGLTLKECNISPRCTLCTLWYSDLIVCFIMQSEDQKKHKESSKGKRGETTNAVSRISTSQYQNKTCRDAWEWVPSSSLSHIGFSQHLAGRVHPGHALSPRERPWISLEKTITQDGTREIQHSVFILPETGFKSLKWLRCKITSIKGIQLLPYLGTENKAMNSKRDSVQCEEVPLHPAPAWSCFREVLLPKKLPTHVAALMSILTATLKHLGQGCGRAKKVKLLLGTFRQCQDCTTIL